MLAPLFLFFFPFFFPCVGFVFGGLLPLGPLFFFGGGERDTGTMRPVNN